MPESKCTPAERVVELVHREQRLRRRPTAACRAGRRSASVVQCGDVRELPAVEDLGDLDAEHHGQLARVDHLARLRGGPDDPQEALAGAAELGVDVVLEGVHVVGLLVRAHHLVAVVLLERVELAERPVLDEVVDHDAHSRPPRALDPLPVGALVGERLVARPAREARPSLRAVRARPGCRWTGSSRRPRPRRSGSGRRSRAAPPSLRTGSTDVRNGSGRRGTRRRPCGCGRRRSRARAPSSCGPLNGWPGDVHLHLGEGRAALGGRRTTSAGSVEATWTSRPSSSHAEVPARWTRS